jgi:hypothetical protein
MKARFYFLIKAVIALMILYYFFGTDGGVRRMVSKRIPRALDEINSRTIVSGNTRHARYSHLISKRNKSRSSKKHRPGILGNLVPDEQQVTNPTPHMEFANVIPREGAKQPSMPPRDRSGTSRSNNSATFSWTQTLRQAIQTERRFQKGEEPNFKTMRGDLVKERPMKTTAVRLPLRYKAFDQKPKESDLRYMDEKTADMLYHVTLLEDDCILSPPPCEDDTYLLIIVISSAGHFKQRASVRNTVNNRPSYRGKKVRFVFLTARADTATDAKMRIESSKYNDIIQANHGDAYSNMTYKALECLKWTMRKCQSAKFLFKIDDDVFVMIENIMEYALSLEAKGVAFVYSGALNCVAIVRDPKSKWYVSREVYKYKTYQPYASGFAILMSRDALQAIYRASFHVPRAYDMPVRQSFPIDDAFIGICAKYANIKLTLLPGACANWYIVKMTLKRDRCAVVKLKAAHSYSGYEEVDIRLFKRLQYMMEAGSCRKKTPRKTLQCLPGST